MNAIRLQTEHLFDPIGIDLKHPRLTWNAQDGARQSAYEISAACNGKEIWNSGKVTSSEMFSAYGGEAKSRQRIEWRVRLWDENDTCGEWSKTASFEFGLLEKADYTAKWINPEIAPFKPEEHQPASYLVKTVTLDSTANARMYATAHGIYALYLNGRRVTENIFTPGTSEYHKRLPVQTFDVSQYVHIGENRIEIVLGDGWWRGSNGNTGERNVFGTDIALWLQMEIDGKAVCVTDETWRAAQNGPIGFNDLQLGERVDARKIPSYHGVRVEPHGTDNFVSANTVPIQEKESFSAKLIRTPSGKTVLDFGQNMAGYVSFSLSAKAGQTVRLTHGEYIGADGEFSDSNLQTIGRKSGELHQVIEYTCRDGRNDYTPTLCIFGFQYVLIETDIPIDGSEFTAHAVYSDMEQMAFFACDHPLVNQLFANAVWSMKSNFVDIPTDCPQRERSGWTGDAALFCSTGILLMDCYPVYARWLAECRADQYDDGRVANFSPRRSPKPSFMDDLYNGSCAWGDASVIVPYTMYRMTGNKRVLEENYDFGKRWLSYCEKRAKRKRMFSKYRKCSERDSIIDTGIHYGEWLEAGISMADAMKDIIFHGAPDVATAYYAQSLRMMSEIAQALDKPEDAKRYRELYKHAKKAFYEVELPNGRITSERQCKYVRPLAMGLLDEADAKQAASDLNALVVKNGYHLNTGFLTTAHLCAVLAKYGYVETAYRLLLQEDNPGWLYQVKQGATTVWESWEGNTGSTGVASLNHYSKGTVVSWLIEGVCGIHADGNTVTISPQPNPLMQYASAALLAPCGKIESAWRYNGDAVEYTITVPANTTATFIAPDGKVRDLTVGMNRFIIG